MGKSTLYLLLLVLVKALSSSYDVSKEGSKTTIKVFNGWCSFFQLWLLSLYRVKGQFDPNADSCCRSYRSPLLFPSVL